MLREASIELCTVLGGLLTALVVQDRSGRCADVAGSGQRIGQLKSDPSSVANAKAQVAAAQDAIVAVNFGSVANPRQGEGFDRGLTRFQTTPGFAVNVTMTELQALANDQRVTGINYDRALRPSPIR